jgi:hypothetical protein
MLYVRHVGMRRVRQRTDQKTPSTYRSNKVKTKPFQAFSSHNIVGTPGMSIHQLKVLS